MFPVGVINAAPRQCSLRDGIRTATCVQDVKRRRLTSKTRVATVSPMEYGQQPARQDVKRRSLTSKTRVASYCSMQCSALEALPLDFCRGRDFGQLFFWQLQYGSLCELPPRFVAHGLAESKFNPIQKNRISTDSGRKESCTSSTRLAPSDSPKFNIGSVRFVFGVHFGNPMLRSGGRGACEVVQDFFLPPSEEKWVPLGLPAP